MKVPSLFYKIYFSVIVVFAVSLITGLFFFHGWLSDYEADQPDQIVGRLIEEHIKTGDLFTLKSEYNIKVSEYESKEGFESALKQLTNNGDITYETSLIKSNDYDSAYTIKVGDKKLLDVYVKKGEKKYSVAKIEFESSVYKSFCITATSDADIKVNGIAVKDSDRTDETLPNIKSDLINSDKIIKKQIIKLDCLLSAPSSITAESGGKALKIDADGDSYNVVQDFPEKEKVGDIAGKAASTYAAYMQNESNLDNIRKYMDTGTDFYKNIRTSLISFALRHDSYAIKDLKVSDFHKYSDRLFSCRVQLSNVMERNDSQYADHFDKYVYLRRDGDSFKVLDMQNIGEESNE